MRIPCTQRLVACACRAALAGLVTFAALATTGHAAAQAEPIAVVPSPCPMARLVPSQPEHASLFGRAVAIDAGTAAVGALLSDSQDGRVHVFTHLGKTWVETASFSHENANELLGLSVDIQQDTLLAAAMGAAYVFERDDGGTPGVPADDTWSETAVLPMPGAGGNEVPCALSATHAVIGASGQKQAWVFARGGPGGWFQQAVLAPLPASGPMWFGEAVALIDDVIAVGDRRDDWFGPQVGAVHVYVRDDAGTFDPADDTWVPRQMLFPVSTLVSKGFGTAVAMNHDEIIVGAPELDSALYVFRRDEHGTPGTPLDDTWALYQVIADPGFLLGRGLDLDGTRLIVRGSQLEHGVVVEGARVYERSILAWSEVARMSPFEALDLAWDVALSGRDALLGSSLYGSPSGTPGLAWLFDLAESSPWTDLHHDLLSDVWHVYPRMAGQGALHQRLITLTQTELSPDVQGYWVVGTSAAMIPFHGGVVVPQPQLVKPWYTPWQGGESSLTLEWPQSVPSGAETYIQYWMLDATAPNRWSATNAILATQP